MVPHLENCRFLAISPAPVFSVKFLKKSGKFPKNFEKFLEIFEKFFENFCFFEKIFEKFLKNFREIFRQKTFRQKFPLKL